MKIVFAFLLFAAGFSEVAAQTINGTYAIRNVKSGMNIRIKDARSENGTPLVAYEPIEWKCMTWDFKQLEGNTYQLKNLFTGKTVQPKNMGKISTLEEQPLTNSPQQRYEFVLAGENKYLIKLAGSDLYLTDEGGQTNQLITLQKQNHTDTQLWTLHEQHPTM